MATEHEAWLALTIEDPIDPDITICDPHHHLWHYPQDHYAVEEFVQDIGGGHKVVQTVFVECGSMYREDGPKGMQPVGETEFVQSITAQSVNGQYGTINIAAGIVGFADLTLGTAVAPVLEAQIAAGKGRLRGIRHGCAWDASPDIISFMDCPGGLLLDTKYQEGVACLQKYGLSFDAWLYHSQLMELVELVQTFPDMTFILDHVGSPLGIGPYAGKRDDVFQEWKRGIDELANYPNVVVKLGGLGMPICGFRWRKQPTPPNSAQLAEAMAPYYLWCIEQFGVHRCMFESNFPVDKRSYSYTIIWNAFKHIVKGFSSSERAALFHDNAVRIYRLSTNNEG